MSVFKSQRNEAVAEFLKATSAVHLESMRMIKKFPKSYRWMITNNMLELAQKAFLFAVRANSIYIYKQMDPNDFDLRHHYFIKSAGCLDALSAEINVIYVLMKDDGNVFKSKSERDKAFFNWIKLVSRAAQLIKGVIKSDKGRYDRESKVVPPTLSELINDAHQQEDVFMGLRGTID